MQNKSSMVQLNNFLKKVYTLLKVILIQITLMLLIHTLILDWNLRGRITFRNLLNTIRVP